MDIGNDQSESNFKISFKSIKIELVTWIDIFRKNFLIIIIPSLIISLVVFGLTFYSKTNYVAKISFVMRSEVNPVTSSLAGISSLLGESGGSNANPMNRILSLSESNLIVGKALLTEASVKNNNDILINHYLKLQDLNDFWKSNPELKRIKFSNSDNYNKLEYNKRKILIHVINKFISNDQLLASTYDKKSEVISIQSIFFEEEFAISFVNAVYEQLAMFYSDEAISSLSSKVNILNKKVDSIKAALLTTQLSAAEETDQSLGLIMQKDRVKQKSLTTKENILVIMFAEAQKNLEQLSYLMATKSPSFRVIDYPYMPLEAQKSKSIFYTLSILIASIIFIASILRLNIFFKSNWN